MVGASDGRAPKGAEATSDTGLAVAAAGVSGDEDEATFRRPSPADDEQTFRKPSPATKADNDAYQADESVTRVGAPVADPYVDDSITADAPAVARRPQALPPQDDTESVTKRKPPQLQGSPDDDSSAQPTAVIVNPHQLADTRPSSNTGHDVVGGMRVGGSDSGLRLTREHVPSGDHGSLSLAPTSARPEQPTILEPVGYVSGAQPSRYDLRIAVVAFVSFAIPFSLFLYLFSLFARDTTPDEPRKAAEVVSDPSPRDDEPRLKAPKAR